MRGALEAVREKSLPVAGSGGPVGAAQRRARELPPRRERVKVMRAEQSWQHPGVDYPPPLPLPPPCQLCTARICPKLRGAGEGIQGLS